MLRDLTRCLPLLVVACVATERAPVEGAAAGDDVLALLALDPLPPGIASLCGGAYVFVGTVASAPTIEGELAGRRALFQQVTFEVERAIGDVPSPFLTAIPGGKASDGTIGHVSHHLWPEVGRRFLISVHDPPEPFPVLGDVPRHL